MDGCAREANPRLVPDTGRSRARADAARACPRDVTVGALELRQVRRWHAQEIDTRHAV